jgi:hypothetical protein
MEQELVLMFSLKQGRASQQIQGQSGVELLLEAAHNQHLSCYCKVRQRQQ